MIVVLTRPENAKSAVKLGYPVFTDLSQIPSGSKVIRWGNGLGADSRNWTHVLNKASVMELSTNKLAALQALKRTVLTPDIWEEGDEVPAGLKIVVRPNSHAEGSDFELVTTPRNYVVPDDRHATRFIEGTREYRVWFVHDKYLVAKRVPRTSEGQTASDPCRSKWAYGPFVEIFPKLKEEMGKARMAIPLDFGAADVLWKDGEGWLFLEINSAPSLDTPTVLGHFQRAISSILGPQTTASVPEVVPVRESAANRQLEASLPAPQSRSCLEPVRRSSWEERYKAELLAKVTARKRELEEEFYRSL